MEKKMSFSVSGCVCAFMVLEILTLYKWLMQEDPHSHFPVLCKLSHMMQIYHFINGENRDMA